MVGKETKQLFWQIDSILSQMFSMEEGIWICRCIPKQSNGIKKNGGRNLRGEREGGGGGGR